MFQNPYFFEIPLFAITVLFSIAYIILLSRLMDGWDDTIEWEIPRDYIPTSKLSVVIAARNEESAISSCIQSILNCNYPEELYEIIIINDHSEDTTAQIVGNFDSSNIKLINLEKSSGKKAALNAGIKEASGSIIVCTDADCIVPTDWLMSYASFIEEKKVKCVAGPISYHCDSSLLQRFQFLDTLNNMCVTANGIQKKSYYMANGANLCFSKQAFEEVGGYKNKQEFASGDDMFLIQSIADAYPEEVSFLKSKHAIVKTQPENTLQKLIDQRTRWATKSKSYNNNNIMIIQGFVFAFVLLIILNIILIPFGSNLSLFGFLFAVFIKLTMDYLYLSKLSDFFAERDPLKSFFSASIGFFAYILFAGWNALRPSKYVWKGRKTR